MARHPVRVLDKTRREFGLDTSAIGPHVHELPVFKFDDLPALSVPTSLISVASSLRIPAEQLEGHMNAQLEQDVKFGNFGQPWQLDGISTPMTSSGLSAAPGMTSLFTKLDADNVALDRAVTLRNEELPGLWDRASMPVITSGLSLDFGAASLFTEMHGHDFGAILLDRRRADARVALWDDDLPGLDSVSAPVVSGGMSLGLGAASLFTGMNALDLGAGLLRADAVALDVGIAPWGIKLPGLDGVSALVMSGGLSLDLGAASLFTALDADGLGTGIDKKGLDFDEAGDLWDNELPGLDGVSAPVVSGGLSLGLGAASLFTGLDADGLGTGLDADALALDAGAELLDFDKADDLWDNELPGLDGVSAPVVSGGLSLGLGAASLFTGLDADAIDAEPELDAEARAALLDLDADLDLWDQLPGLDGVSAPVVSVGLSVKAVSLFAGLDAHLFQQPESHDGLPDLQDLFDGQLPEQIGSIPVISGGLRQTISLAGRVSLFLGGGMTLDDNEYEYNANSGLDALEELLLGDAPAVLFESESLPTLSAGALGFSLATGRLSVLTGLEANALAYNRHRMLDPNLEFGDLSQERSLPILSSSRHEGPSLVLGGSYFAKGLNLYDNQRYDIGAQRKVLDELLQELPVLREGVSWPLTVSLAQQRRASIMFVPTSSPVLWQQLDAQIVQSRVVDRRNLDAVPAFTLELNTDLLLALSIGSTTSVTSFTNPAQIRGFAYLPWQEDEGRESWNGIGSDALAAESEATLESDFRLDYPGLDAPTYEGQISNEIAELADTEAIGLGFYDYRPGATAADGPFLSAGVQSTTQLRSSFVSVKPDDAVSFAVLELGFSVASLSLQPQVSFITSIIGVSLPSPPLAAPPAQPPRNPPQQPPLPPSCPSDPALVADAEPSLSLLGPGLPIFGSAQQTSDDAHEQAFGFFHSGTPGSSGQVAVSVGQRAYGTRTYSW